MVSKTFEIDSFYTNSQECATRVFSSLGLPRFQYRALVWTWMTPFGKTCFSSAYKIASVTLPGGSSASAWIAAINKASNAQGLGKLRTTAPLRSLQPGTVTIAFSVGPNGWLLGRPGSDRAPHMFFARS
jgi:hypothetical protein